MQTVVVNGIDFHVATEGDTITVNDNNNNELIVAEVDHNLEHIQITIIDEDGGDEQESVDYFEFQNDSCGLIEWMCNRTFD